MLKFRFDQSIRLTHLTPDDFNDAFDIPWVPEVLFFFRDERAVKNKNLWSRRFHKNLTSMICDYEHGR